jgi:hypothetical protein
MISMEERVNYLDSIMAELARAQVQTEIAFKASGVRMDALFRKMEADTARMKKDTAESSSRLDEALLRREAADARMQEDTRRMKQVWGDLANKMGTVAEDVVAPNIPRLALEEFGFSEVEDLMVRARRASRRGEKRQSEWDVVCSGPEKVIVVEVKSTPTRDKIREVPAHLAEFFDFFPEYEGRELIGVFASWAIDPRLLPAISEAGLYGIAMGEDTMDIVARPAGHQGAGAS